LWLTLRRVLLRAMKNPALRFSQQRNGGVDEARRKSPDVRLALPGNRQICTQHEIEILLAS